MSSSSASAFAGFRFPREVISVAVRWYLRYRLSYRDVEELLAERGVNVDHVTVYRWVQRFTPEFVEAARPRRHMPGDRWFVDETYVKVNGRWTYLYRAVDQFGQVIDVWLSARSDLSAADLLHPSTRHRSRARRGHHGPGTCLPASPRRAGPNRDARHRAVRQQQSRGRPWSAQSQAATDAWPQDLPISSDPRYRSRVCPEPATRPLRHRHRRASPPPAAGGLRRTRARHLTGASGAQPCRPIDQRNRAPSRPPVDNRGEPQ